MERVINVVVSGEFVQKDNKNAGVQGEANATTLHIVMSDEWSAYSKRIIWRNALGENPVAVLLHNSAEALLAGQNPLAFDTPIPAEPLALPGWCSFTIEGFRDSDPTAVSISVTNSLLVKPSSANGAPTEPTPGQAQQLQLQIEEIVPQVVEIVGEAVALLEHTEEAISVWDVWNRDTTYVPLNKVSHLGNAYICKEACVGIDPYTDTSGGTVGHYWLLIAQKGSQGVQGEVGSQGMTGQQGLQGERGLQGMQGIQGMQGERGLQGVEGTMGIQGPHGPQGEQGERGVDGVAVATDGIVAFNVTQDGVLQCSYMGDVQPDFFIGEDGHLYWTA